ncbi:MAG: hypothetical protein AAB425_02410, partial [Bdellovibrionota bacterium]
MSKWSNSRNLMWSFLFLLPVSGLGVGCVISGENNTEGVPADSLFADTSQLASDSSSSNSSDS